MYNLYICINVYTGLPTKDEAKDDRKLLKFDDFKVKLYILP